MSNELHGAPGMAQGFNLSSGTTSQQPLTSLFMIYKAPFASVSSMCLFNYAVLTNSHHPCEIMGWFHVSGEGTEPQRG